MYNLYYIKDTNFGRVSANYLKERFKECDLFVGFASFSLESIREAKKAGCTTVLERGSSHILHQRKLLEEEFSLFGMKFQMPDKLVERQLKEYEETDYISVPSNFVLNSFLEMGFPKNRLFKIPYGVEIKIFPKIEKQDKIFRVIFVGILSLQKGIPYLLEAFKRLNLPNAELLLVGTVFPEIKPILRRYQGWFRYLGYIPQEKLHQFYSNSSVFVLPSLQEGFGMVLGEAMSCGLPVITTTNTGGNEIIRNGIDGFIIPIRNIDALKEKILFFYENEEARIAMGSSGAEYIKNFTWDRYGENIVENYERLLEREI